MSVEVSMDGVNVDVFAAPSNQWEGNWKSGEKISFPHLAVCQVNLANKRKEESAFNKTEKKEEKFSKEQGELAHWSSTRYWQNYPL